MSNNETPPDGNRQVPVETYKCSQCNFYTNHEYYLQQHSLTHSLQVLMEHYKRTQPNYDPDRQPQTYIKPHNIALPTQVPPETLQCMQCNFETNQESYYKQHLMTHDVQVPADSYRVNMQSNFETMEENYPKMHSLGNNVLSNESFGNHVVYEPGQEINIKPHDLTQSTNSFDTDLIKAPDIVECNFETLKCTVNNCNFIAHNENEWKQHSLNHDLHTPCPEVFRCLKCDFQSHLEKDLKQHIKEHERVAEQDANLLKSEEVQPPKEVFRCNNCDYETNLKAFLKRHMLNHTLKVEVKEEITEKFKCSECSFETEHEKFLQRHEMSHKQDKPFKCGKCHFETLYKKMMIKHLAAHKSKKLDKEKVNNQRVVHKLKGTSQKTKENTIIKCSECIYETYCKDQLEIHKKLRHTDVKENDINLHKCEYCKYQTNWEPCLKRHIEREHPDALKPAKKVRGRKKQEKVEETLQNEVKTEYESDVQQNDMFRCYNCDFSSKSKHYLVLHLKRAHINTESVKIKQEKLEEKPKSTKSYECKFRNCKFQTSIRSNYVHHLRKHQSQNPQRIMFHFCDLCDFIAKTEDNLNEHKKRMHMNQMKQVYKCNQCDFKTIFKHNMKTHSIKHKKYTCNVCEVELESAYALVKHKKTHQVNPKNRIFLCDVCGFQSKNDRSLKMHKKTHNPEFKCPDCPFQTHSKVNFQNHCINHKSADEVTMFPCPHCSYQSRLKRNLAWHMKRHADPSKAKIFKCPSCEYQTFTNAQLKSHLMVHKSKEEVIMLKCDFCSFETKRKSNMVQHRLRHLKDSPDVPLLSCPDCNYTTVAKRHLNKHRKTHNVNPDKMFQCTYCPYKIHRKAYLMRHMENHKTLETFGNDQWPRYTFPPPQQQMPITGVTVVPNLGQNLGPSLM